MEVFNFLFMLSFCYIFLTYLVKEYYSPHRLIKGIISVFKNDIKLLIFFILYVFSVLICIFNLFLSQINSLIVYLFLIIFLPKIEFKVTQRNLRLIIVVIVLNIIILCFHNNYFVLFTPFLALCILLLSFILLLPIEISINNYFISKARKKIKRINPYIVGITGSFGKTTFKTYLHHFLKSKYTVIKSPYNYNTLMGLTKFINQDLNSNVKYLILEIGIDKNHGIKKFKKLFTLDVGVIVGVGKVHLSTFKKYKNIVNSKCEIDYLLKKQGILFVNDNYSEIKRYKFTHKVNYYKNIVNFNLKINEFQNHALNGVIEIAKFLNVEDYKIKYCLQNLPSITRRGQIQIRDNVVLINDSYNINFEGIKMALKQMFAFEGIKIVITGGLIELGKDFNQDNYLLGKSMKDIDYLFLITTKKNHPLIKGFKEVNPNNIYIVKSIKEIYRYIESINGKKVILLSAKGSDFFLN